MKIGFYLMGGLGNMLFQIATAENMRRTNIEVYYPNLEQQFNHLEKTYSWTRHAREYLSIFQNFNWGKDRTGGYDIKDYRIANIPFVYTPIVPEDKVLYKGYFQSELNFLDREHIQWLFEPNKDIQERVEAIYSPFKEKTTCSIHVRRGDYLTLQGIHPVQTMDYYNKAIECLKPFKIDQYIVFSNDIEWCKQNFVGDQYVFVQDADYIELFLMTKCNHNIIANSSFSWWGAWLPEQLDRVVIAPQNWFGNNTPDAKDVVPVKWIKY